MRILLFFLAIFCCSTVPSQARSRRGTLVVELSDRTPLTIEINGRRFDRTGTSLTVGDLPPGRHSLRVYAVSTTRYGKRNADLIYNGTVRLLTRGLTHCVVDPVQHTARVQVLSEEAAQRNVTAAPIPAPSRPSVQRAAPPEPAGNSSVPPSAPLLSAATLQNIEEEAAQKATDGEKLETVKSGLNGARFSSEDARRVAGLLTFEETRLEFARWARARVSDPESFALLEGVFSMDENKEAFRSELMR